VGVRLLVGLLLSVVVAACSRGNEPAASARPQPVPVAVANAEQKPMPIELTGVGNVLPSETVSVRPQVGGQIGRIHFREGEDVRRGQVLFTIDAPELVAQLRQAKANLARNLALAENARRESARYAELVQQGFVSRSQAEQLAANAAAATATAEADRAAVQNAQVLVDHTTVRAPIDGRTGRALVDPGNVVRPNETDLVVINRLRPIEVTFAVPGQYLDTIQARRQGGPLEVEARLATDAPPAHGRLTFVDNRVDPTTGTIQLKGTFANDDVRLWPGAFVNATLRLGIQPDAIVVPAPAVQAGPQGDYVFIVRADHTVEQRPVRVDRRVGDAIVIASGLRAGEPVVTEGHLRLAPGVAVEMGTPREEGAAASPGT
jgi:membrane fusion protein, multidrug efflux system